MYYRTASSFPYSSTASECQEWDPETVLELTNPLKGCVTCIGYAPSRGRRCQNRIAANSISYALSIVNKLALKNAYKAAASPQLESAVTCLLCTRFHKNQATDVVKGWRSKLEYLAARNERANSSSHISDETSTESEESDNDSSDDDDDDDDDDYDNKNDNKSAGGGQSIDEVLEMLKEIRETVAELKRENAKLKKDVKVKFEPEEGDQFLVRKAEVDHQKRVGEARRRQEEEEEEKCRQERQKRRDEEARRQEQERRRREEEEAVVAARTRAFQERARLARQRREREQKEKAEKEAAEWRASWEEYTKGWDGGSRLTAISIPWPVKSGFWWDVTEANVRLFFAKAPPEELRASPRARLNLVNRELRRWHTDKVMQKLGSGVANGFIKSTLDAVAMVLVELRKDARRACKT
ncbi:hypothetical protein F5X99DRAFT_149683 [Biscogniauxia marginata]|nr:hypothetical protein F5X99DRAFT_149683 [Biscogniauxia marginata]